MLGQTVDVVLADGTRREALLTKALVRNRSAPKGVYVVTEETDLILQDNDSAGLSRRVRLSALQISISS